MNRRRGQIADTRLAGAVAANGGGVEEEEEEEEGRSDEVERSRLSRRNAAVG